MLRVKAAAAIAAVAAAVIAVVVAAAAVAIAAVVAAVVTAVNLPAVIDLVNQYFARKAAKAGPWAAFCVIRNF